jgi:hypothetical protein
MPCVREEPPPFHVKAIGFLAVAEAGFFQPGDPKCRIGSSDLEKVVYARHARHLLLALTATAGAEIAFCAVGTAVLVALFAFANAGALFRLVFRVFLFCFPFGCRILDRVSLHLKTAKLVVCNHR